MIGLGDSGKRLIRDGITLVLLVNKADYHINSFWKQSSIIKKYTVT